MMGPATRKQRKTRQNSNVFAMIDQQQMEELKQAFYMMDTNGDGVICHDDLEIILKNLGQNMTNEQIQDMLNEAPGSKINFMMFLTMMADKLTGTDHEHVITSAFAAFDDSGKGTINADYLRDCMTTMGDRFTDEEVDIMFQGTPVDEHGNFNYKDFVQVLKHGV
ncbi:EF-hand [Lichtheimia hyalospora FSU 10163]|nr:EF-hand [Lichtheimia hyalospora FSU 10163]